MAGRGPAIDDQESMFASRRNMVGKKENRAARGDDSEDEVAPKKAGKARGRERGGLGEEHLNRADLV